jgi:hypothetical protein
MFYKFADISIKNYCKNNLNKDRQGRNYICPFCSSGAHNDSGLRLYEKDNSFYCFACKTGGEIFHIHGRLNGLGYRDAKKDLLGDNYSNYNKRNIIFNNDNLKFEEHQPINIFNYDEFRKKNSKPTELNMREFIIDNISFDVIKEFKLQYRYNKYYSKKIGEKIVEKQIVIPVFDYKGRFIGADVRNFGYSFNNAKYRPYQSYDFETKKSVLYNIKKSENLFGIWQNQNTIKNTKEVMLCESQKAVMQAKTYGYNMTLGLCGSNLSYYQIHLLKNMEVKKIIIAIDREFDTNKQTYKSEDGILHKSYKGFMYDICNMANKINKIIPDAEIYLMQDLKGNYQKGAYLNYKDAPTDKGKEVFYTLYNSKKEINNDVINNFHNNECKKTKYIK